MLGVRGAAAVAVAVVFRRGGSGESGVGRGGTRVKGGRRWYSFIL